MSNNNKVFHAYTSKEGGQTSYYFTDAKDENLANKEAVKKAVIAFNNEKPKIEKIDNEFVGLPETVKEPYVWFVGADDLFSGSVASLEESNEAATVAEVKTAKPKKSKKSNTQSRK